MKFFAILAAAAIGLVAAQDMAGQPACATDCIISAIAAVGCQPTDVGCQCSAEKAKALEVAAGPCLVGKCEFTDLIKAQSAGKEQCSKYAATSAGGGAQSTGKQDNTASITSAPSTGTAAGAAATSSTRTGGVGAVHAAMVTNAAFVVGVLGAVAAM